LMEDLATLEISRAQVWQWIHHNVELDDGIRVDRDLVACIFDEELEKIEAEYLAQLEVLDPELMKHQIRLFQIAKDDACRIFLEKEFRPFLKLSTRLAGAGN
ncbi:MAG: hypothetical protein P8Y44_14105, partial [Acidobacteriota bacterium]